MEKEGTMSYSETLRKAREAGIDLLKAAAAAEADSQFEGLAETDHKAFEAACYRISDAADASEGTLDEAALALAERRSLERKGMKPTAEAFRGLDEWKDLIIPAREIMTIREAEAADPWKEADDDEGPSEEECEGEAGTEPERMDAGTSTQVGAAGR
jgi:hypothetical protein